MSLNNIPYLIIVTGWSLQPIRATKRIKNLYYKKIKKKKTQEHQFQSQILNLCKCCHKVNIYTHCHYLLSFAILYDHTTFYIESIFLSWRLILWTVFIFFGTSPFKTSSKIHHRPGKMDKLRSLIKVVCSNRIPFSFPLLTSLSQNVHWKPPTKTQHLSSY